MQAGKALELYQTLADLTRDMRDAANTEDWDRFLSLNQEREPVFARLRGADPIADMTSDELTRKDTLISGILSDDRDNRVRVEAWMNAHDQEMRETRRELKLLREYAKAGGQ